MKATLKDRSSVKDGTPFVIRFELKDLKYTKMCGNETAALYSVSDKKLDKLRGFAVMTSKNKGKLTFYKSLKDIKSFKQFQ